MELSNLFYRYPRLVVLTLGLILVAGLSALNALPRQEDPNLTGRYADVITYFPGASAVRVEALVTEKVENVLKEIEEIKRINSNSRTGVSNIDIDLEDTVTNVDEVWSRVRDKLVDIEPDLPEAALPPELHTIKPTAFTFLVGFTWTLDDHPQIDLLYRLAKELEQRFAPMAGTQETKIFGELEEEILVSVDPMVMASANLTATEVSRAIAQADAKIPAGQLHSDSNELVIEITGELDSADRIRRIPLRREEDGRFLRVGDIAQVTKTARQPPLTLALVDGKPGIMVGAKMETNRRVDLWSDEARKIFENFAHTLPQGVNAEVIFDQSGYTRDRLGGLTQNLAMGMAIVILILFVMMGWKSALVVSAALPLTTCMVLTSLNLLSVPLQQISITGLIIALGLLIDNAIVAVNEYQKDRQQGLEIAQAIASTVKRLFIPLSASTITTALTFVPIVIMPGGTGEFVGSMGLVVIISIFSSLFLSLTIIPSLAGMLDTGEVRPGFWRNGISHLGFLPRYRSLLDGMLKRPWTGVLAGLVLPLFGFALSTQLTEQFFPPVDRAQFQIQLKLPPQASIAETLRNVERVREILHAHPEVLRSHWFIGDNPPRVFYNAITTQEGVISFAGAFIDTTSPAATQALLPKLQREMIDLFPNAMVLTLPFEQGPPVEAPIEVSISGPDLNTLQRLGEELRVILGQSNGVTYTQAQITGGRPKLNMTPDEDKASLAGFQLVELANQLNASLEGVIGGTVLEDTEELPVRVRLRQKERSDLGRIAANTLLPPQRTGRSDSNILPGVPLNAVTQVSLVPEINAITRESGERVNTVQGYVEPYFLPGKAREDFVRRLAESNFELPSGYELDYGGEVKERAEAIRGLLSALLPLLTLMIAVVVLAFNSFLLAGIIGLVALQGVGLTLFTLWLFGYPMGFMAIIGTMGLIGLAINDSIVVLAALNENQRARLADLEAIRDVVVESTRHIVSTTLTTVGGFLPLILFGGTFWPPLAVAISGGLVGATLLALLFVPAVFTYVALRAAAKRNARAGENAVA
jgi:multidrug efflux pump subunit AcrB